MSSVLIGLIALVCSLSAQSKTGLIVGQVIDGTTGRPVSGVMVTLEGGAPAADNVGDRTPPPRPVMTDDSGGFVFSGLAAGSYGMTAVRSGFAEGSYGRLRPGGNPTGLALADGARIGDIRIRVWKFGAIAGTVTDEAGEPVIGVRVRAMRSTFLAGRRRLVAETTAFTDDRGMYRIGALVPADYVVVVPSVQTTLPADIAVEAANPPPGSSVAAAVSFLRPIGPASGGTRDIGTAVGAFVLQSNSQELAARANPAQSNEGLAVYPTTYNGDATTARQAPPITLGSGETRVGADVHLRPTPTWRVSGRLLGPEGTVALQALRLFPASLVEDLSTETGLETAATLTDRTGAFTFLGVPPGQYILRANKFPDLRLAAANQGSSGPAADAWWLAEAVVVGNQDVTITATWHDAFSLSGRVVFDGASAPSGDRQVRVPIVVESVDQRQIPGTSRPAQIAPDGTFSTPRIPLGRYLVRVGSAPSGWALRSVVADGKDISDTGLDLKGPVTDIIMTFTDRVTSLTGTVRTAQGLAATDATALLFPVDPAGWQDFGLNPRRLKSTRVESAGTYSFPDVPAGDYFVIAIPEEEAAIWREPGRLTTFSRVATRVHLVEGEKKTEDLRPVVVR